MAKKDLQATADELGIQYAKSDTVAVLEAKIAAALDDGRCKACGRPGGSNHVHTRLKEQ